MVAHFERINTELINVCSTTDLKVLNLHPATRKRLQDQFCKESATPTPSTGSTTPSPTSNSRRLEETVPTSPEITQPSPSHLTTASTSPLPEISTMIAEPNNNINLARNLGNEPTPVAEIYLIPTIANSTTLTSTQAAETNSPLPSPNLLNLNLNNPEPEFVPSPSPSPIITKKVTTIASNKFSSIKKGEARASAHKLEADLNNPEFVPLPSTSPIATKTVDPSTTPAPSIRSEPLKSTKPLSKARTEQQAESSLSPIPPVSNNEGNSLDKAPTSSPEPTKNLQTEWNYWTIFTTALAMGVATTTILAFLLKKTKPTTSSPSIHYGFPPQYNAHQPDAGEANRPPNIGPPGSDSSVAFGVRGAHPDNAIKEYVFHIQPVIAIDNTDVETEIERQNPLESIIVNIQLSGHRSISTAVSSGLGSRVISSLSGAGDGDGDGSGGGDDGSDESRMVAKGAEMRREHEVTTRSGTGDGGGGDGGGGGDVGDGNFVRLMAGNIGRHKHDASLCVGSVPIRTGTEYRKLVTRLDGGVIITVEEDNYLDILGAAPPMPEDETDI
jgi:hypothetical protein